MIDNEFDVAVSLSIALVRKNVEVDHDSYLGARAPVTYIKPPYLYPP